MDSARWEQIEAAFHEVVAHPDFERPSILDSICGNDGPLREQVLVMLEADQDSASLVDRGLRDIALQVFGSPLDSISAREFGPYRLIRLVGEGGMGVVWLAERRDAGNPVAIKFLPHAGLSPARRERFAREIRTLAKLKHPFIARLYDAGALPDGTPWFVMEYVEGVSLTRYCEDRTLSIEKRIRLVRFVCEAVQYAHGQEIIHRDLKPSNILVEADGTPRLLDFGIARELQNPDEANGEPTRLGLRFLSPNYAAPEWAREGIAGACTDVYSLGVILFETLTGRLPPGRTENGIEEGLAAASQRDLGISKASRRELDVLCHKAMHKDAAKRYQSVEALIRDIDHYLNHQPLEARPDSRRYRLSKFVRRNRGAVFATCLAFVIITGVIAFFTARLSEERNTALAEAARAERTQSFMLNLFEGGDKETGPAEDLRVIALIDRGAAEAQVLNRDPQVQAELFQTLGTMYQKLGRLDRADAFLQSSLRVRKSMAKPDDVGVTDNLIVLGLLRSDQGRSREAEQLVGEALTVIQSRKPRNETLLRSANAALGKVLLDRGAYGEAVKVLNRAASFQSDAAAPPAFARILNTLADAQTYLGHYSVSDSLNRRALAIDRTNYGDHHPQVSDDLDNLAQIQEMWGHYTEAVEYERQALRISESWYGKDHPDTARKKATLAQTLIYQGHYEEASDLLTEALAIQKRAYGEAHPRVAFVLNLLGGVANQRRDFKTAEADDQRVAEIYRSAYGDGDYRVAVALGNLGSVYFAEKRYATAEEVFRDVVGRCTKSLSADNINTGMAEIKLGRTLLSERRYQEAGQYTRAGYEVLLKQTAPSTSFIEGARHDLAIIYEALGRPEEARKFRMEPAPSGEKTTAGR